MTILSSKARRPLLSWLPALAVLAIGGFSIYLLRDVAMRSERLVNAQTNVALDAQRLQWAFESKSASGRGYLLSGQVSSYLETMDRMRSIFLDLLEQLRASLHGQNEIKLLDTIERLEAEHDRGMRSLILRRRKGESLERLQSVFAGELAHVRRELKEHLRVLATEQESLLERNRDEFASRVHTVEILIGLLSLVGALFVFGMITFVSRASQERRLRLDLQGAVDQLERSRGQLRELTLRLHRAQEMERSRIAREIHDELGQSLTVLKMQVHQLKRQSDSEILGEMSQSIDRLVQDVRGVASDLRPSILEDAGLGAAVEWLVGDFRRRTEFQVRLTLELSEGDLHSEAGNRYPEDVSIAVYRILQEALTNAARHSGSRTLDVIVREMDGSVELLVRDYGRGQTNNYESSSSSWGVVGMRERAETLGGDFSIAFVPGQGTVVCASVPLSGAERREVSL